jgi:hypothetical protein
MGLFSLRHGFKPVKNIIQVDSIDADLRNRLWNALSEYYWTTISTTYLGISIPAYTQTLLNRLWNNYYKKPMDTMPNSWNETYNEIRIYFFTSKWFEVYDFIEFIANEYPGSSYNLTFMVHCNSILKEELSAYRFVGGKIAQITKEEEIVEIEEALNIPDSLKPIKIHLKTSIDLLANRKSPDYRNSIKEAISAVEAICKLIANNNKATLGLAIETIEKGKKVKMHSALGRGFSNLYGYTNAADGIRHALLDEPDLDFEDAKFMLVSCSAFINYLIVKASKAGIKL